MGTIPQWTGVHVRALRAARRMSVRDFAAHLGVSDRMVSKWEAGGEAARPRASNQAALDMSLKSCNAETRARFESLAGDAVTRVEGIGPHSGGCHLVCHPVDGKLMTLVEPGPYVPSRGEAVWLPGYYIDVMPTTGSDYAQFITETGHRAPAQWPGGTLPESLAASPVQVPWNDAQVYLSWAGKALPTPMQWDRAAGGDEGMVPGPVAEWCDAPRGLRRHEAPSGVTSGPPGFRCVLPVDDLLALLAI